MSIASTDSTQQSRLRHGAEARLKAGSAPPTVGWPTGASGLNLLHRLASAQGERAIAVVLGTHHALPQVGQFDRRGVMTFVDITATKQLELARLQVP